jgi:hypothetical protein
MNEILLHRQNEFTEACGSANLTDLQNPVRTAAAFLAICSGFCTPSKSGRLQVVNQTEPEEMLTAKQEAFSKLVADGQPQADAYRQAYNAESMKPAVVWSEASRLASHPKVAARIERLQAERDAIRSMLVLDQEEAILLQLQHEALTARTDSARIKALELLGKHAGMFSERPAPPEAQRTAEEIEAALLVRLKRLADYL